MASFVVLYVLGLNSPFPPPQSTYPLPPQKKGRLLLHAVKCTHHTHVTWKLCIHNMISVINLKWWNCILKTRFYNLTKIVFWTHDFNWCDTHCTLQCVINIAKKKMNCLNFIMLSTFKWKNTLNWEYKSMYEFNPNSKVSFNILHTFIQTLTTIILVSI